jgi:hypothetical protein
MNPLILIATIILIFAAMLVMFVFIPRIRMQRRAIALLAQHPNAEQTSVYLALHSSWRHGKQREIDAKIAEMGTAGWSYLRASEANFWRTLRSWGGGVTLHFLRIDG